MLPDPTDAVTPQLDEVTASLHRYLISELPLGSILHRVTGLALQVVAPATAAGLTLLDQRGRFNTVAATSRTTGRLDQAQYEDDSGPCVDACRTNRIIRVDDAPQWVSTWPGFSRVAADDGILSVLSVPVSAEERRLGAFNLYATERRAFSDPEERQAQLFAAQAAIVLANASAYWDTYNRAENLAKAMESRATIEQAKGMIMASRGCTADQAFEILVKASQRTHVRLRDLAERIVEHAADRPPADRPKVRLTGGNRPARP